MLNPEQSVIINRYSSLSANDIERYKQSVDTICQHILKTKNNNRLATDPLISHTKNLPTVSTKHIQDQEDIIKKITTPNTKISYAVIPLKTWDLIKSLIKKGTNLDLKDRLGPKALLHAAQIGEWKTVKYFIDIGISVNAYNIHNKTALWFAAFAGNYSPT